jgi:hypothetical protein
MARPKRFERLTFGFGGRRSFRGAERGARAASRFTRCHALSPPTWTPPTIAGRSAPGLGGAETCPRAGSARGASAFVRRRQAYFPFMRASDEAGYYCVEGMAVMAARFPRVYGHSAPGSPPLV